MIELNIAIKVRDKIASLVDDSSYIVCGNSDYVLTFDFDSEWDEHYVKTARFSFGTKYIDVVFEGNTCVVPVLVNITFVKVGVMAGNLTTTTPALIPCKKSISDEGGTPVAPTPDVYAQIVSLCNEAVETANEVDERTDGVEQGGAKAFTVTDMTFAPIVVNPTDYAFKLHYDKAGTVEATELDGRKVVKIAVDNTCTDEVILTCHEMTNADVDWSVFKYVSIDIYLKGKRPLNTNPGVSFTTANSITKQKDYRPSGYIGNGMWTTSSCSIASLNDVLDPTKQKHRLSVMRIKPCYGAKANQYNAGTEIYVGDIKFYQKDPSIVQNTTYTLDSVAGLAVGDEYSTHILTYEEFDENTPEQSIQTEQAGVITDITGKVVTVSKIPNNIHRFEKRDSYLTEDGWDSEINTFRVVAKPTVGTRDLGHNAINLGIKTEAHSKGAIAEGSGCVAYGSFAKAIGVKCKSAYASFAGGVGCWAKKHHNFLYGLGLLAKRSSMAGVGSYNEAHTDSMFEVGIGSADGDRRNGLTVKVDGRVSVGANPIEAKDVVTLEYLNEVIANLKKEQG